MGFSKSEGWNLVWNEEFDGTYIDRSKWDFEIGYIRNNELQYYTDRNENAWVENSNLVIEARREDFNGHKYTSASLNTNGRHSFKYGRIEMRAKLPYGKGIWPAFWTLGSNFNTVGWPDCGEIDIMELVGGGIENDAKTYANLHWGNKDIHENVSGSMVLESGIFADDYHVIGIEWDEKQISWYVDDRTYYTAAIDVEGMEAFHRSHFILINLAVGGNWPGSPDESTVFPQRYYIDWVRVYEKTK
jgi:beta-glucanase (GH16 family)